MMSLKKNTMMKLNRLIKLLLSNSNNNRCSQTILCSEILLLVIPMPTLTIRMEMTPLISWLMRLTRLITIKISMKVN